MCQVPLAWAYMDLFLCGVDMYIIARLQEQISYTARGGPAMLVPEMWLGRRNDSSVSCGKSSASVYVFPHSCTESILLKLW